MTPPTYTEPQVSFLVLDFQREAAARACLQSLRDHIKVPAKIIYCHNGVADYPLDLLKAGYIDELIMPRVNGGLGLGTRALFAASFSPYSVYWQVDQIMGRPFEQRELDALAQALDTMGGADEHGFRGSISLAGPVCGHGVFSERAFVIETAFYRQMEYYSPGLGAGGAGPWHHLPWREGAIQEYYRRYGYTHLTNWPPLAIDNGRDAVRQNPDGSVWKHEPDRKGLWLLKGPIKERYVYPRFSDSEWCHVLKTQSWPAGQIPELEKEESFHVWN